MISAVLSPLLIFAGILLYGASHSLLAGLRTKALARKWVGVKADRYYRVLFNVIAFITLIPVLALPAFLPDRLIYQVTPPANYFMLGVQILSGTALLVTFFQTDTMSFIGFRQLIQGLDASRPEKLTISGFYHWMRHPLYTFTLICLWTSPKLTLNFMTLFIGVTLYMVIGAFFEERKLEKTFGRDYRDYKTRTPMFIPGLF